MEVAVCWLVVGFFYDYMFYYRFYYRLLHAWQVAPFYQYSATEMLNGCVN